MEKNKNLLTLSNCSNQRNFKNSFFPLQKQEEKKKRGRRSNLSFVANNSGGFLVFFSFLNFQRD